MSISARKPLSRLGLLSGVALLSVATLLAGCSSGGSSGAGDGSSDETIHVTIITKDPNDPFWVAMVDGAEEAGAEENVELTVAAGRDHTDSDSQIQAIENAIARGDDAILIANNGPATNDAVQKAIDAGLLVVALDTPFTPADLVPATYATDNREAGKLIGEWAAGALDGADAKIALLDLYADKIVSIDYERGQGFLEGFGVPLNDENKNGDEEATGTYSGGAGGNYEIVCNEFTEGAEDGGRTGMENCLSLDPDINVVYTPNEPSALGAVQALKAAGNDAMVVTINGSCDGVQGVVDGQFGADAQQYPSEMGAAGVRAAVDFVRNGVTPENPAGEDFTNTGVKLITDQPIDGLDSISSEEGLAACY
jgi:fructose transport system substrate-binding protein